MKGVAELVDATSVKTMFSGELRFIDKARDEQSDT